MATMPTSPQRWSRPAASRTVQITVDCHDPEKLARFWAEALGYIIPGPPGVRLSDDEDPLAAWKEFLAGLGIDLSPETIRAAPGLDGDERMETLKAECRRLVELGATRLRRVDPDPPMEQSFIVMADPKGNEFCLD